MKNKVTYCTKNFTTKATILLQITEDNLPLLSKIQELSCTKFAIGDYIAKDEDNQALLFDKDLKPKSFNYSKRFKYELDTEALQIISREIKPQKLKYMEVLSNEQLTIAKFFINDVKKGDFLVSGSRLYHTDVISKEVFHSDYTVTN